MIEELIHAGDERPLKLFWGTRGAGGLYAAELIRSWQKQHSAMIHAARPAFLDAGVPEERLFYDSFDFAPDVPPSVE